LGLQYPIVSRFLSDTPDDGIPPPNISVAHDVVAEIVSHLREDQAAWLVPQAFGGGEQYPREPTPAELRAMTYLGWIGGATGLLYFKHDDAARQLRLPASPALYAEAIKLAVEARELGPAIAARPKAAPAVTVRSAACGAEASSVGCLRARAFPERTGSTLVLVANLANAMLPVDVAVAGLNTSALGSGGSNAGGTYCGDHHASDGSGIQVEVLFEHRNVSVRASDGSGGVSFGDFVAPLGTRAYRIHAAHDDGDDGKRIKEGNLVLNPSFESAEGGGLVPDGLWAKVGADIAASYAADGYTSVHGRHSLRVQTPTDGEGQGLQ